MSFFFEEPQAPFGWQTAGGEAGLGEIADAAHDTARFIDNFNSRHAAREEAWDRRLDAAKAATGVDIANPLRAAVEPILRLQGPVAPRTEQMIRGWHEGVTNARLAALALQHPDKAEKFSGRSIDEEAAAIAREAESRFGTLFASRPGAGRWLATLWGGGLGTLRDPIQTPLLALGAGPGAARTIGGAVLKGAAREALLNAGVEAAMQPVVQDWRADAGLAAGWQEAARNVLFAGTIGGMLGAVAGGIGQALRSRLPAEARGAADALEADQVAVAERPQFVPADPHDEATAAAILFAEDPDANPPPAPPVAPPPQLPAIAAEDSLAPQNFRWFEPRELAIDAARFQFKAGGDEAGVTERLRGVTTWDASRAGVTIVWEDAAGGRFIADGHQRHGLARRIGELGSETPKLAGYVFREADGFSAEDVRTIAALKNIAEGSGTALDAAKVLRSAPGAEHGLPPNSALVRDGEGLAKLSDDAFAMAVNDVVDASYAAIVGRLVGDEKLHAQVLAAMAEARPSSRIEAESMVRDLLSAPVVREVQENLFGAEEGARLLLKERAQVRSAAFRAIKRDRTVFQTLVDEAERIAAAGNELSTDTNARRASEDAVLLEHIAKLSDRKGPIADALATAARDVAGGAGVKAASRAYLDAVRDALSRAGGSGERAGAGRSGVELPVDTPPARSSEATPAGEQGLVPGVAPVTTRERLQVEAERPLAGGAAPAGGLFDEDGRAQIDLLDAIGAARLTPEELDQIIADPFGGAGEMRVADALEEADRPGLLADLVDACKVV